MNPAFEESAMFENMVDLMLGGEYDVYVFDTAPTANARRLLGMSQVYSLWVNKMVKSRDEARSLRELLSFTKKKEKDPLMEYLVAFRARMGKARVAMQDRYMVEVWEKFEGMVRAKLPLYETEVRGVPSLNRMADSLFG